MSAVTVKPMAFSFESGNLDDDKILDYCGFLLDGLDLLELEEAHRWAREQGGMLVVRLARVGVPEGEGRRMLVFALYTGGSPMVWRGTLGALRRETS
jgi:hypothetical protein